VTRTDRSRPGRDASGALPPRPVRNRRYAADVKEAGRSDRVAQPVAGLRSQGLSSGAQNALQARRQRL